MEVDQIFKARAYMGLNDYDFSWRLEHGKDFQTPEVVMVYSSKGFGEMSRTMHDLYRQYLVRGRYRDEVRPILANNWEATYFDFDEDKILALAKEASDLGVELFVLDDGWFGRRDNDDCSLGDWSVYKDKLPDGIAGLASRIKEYGMKFGLWFEPEMVSPDSDLYREHPDWCIHVPGRMRTECRNQLVLDLSRQEVRDHIVSTISHVLDTADITSVKWDMNRHMTDLGSFYLDGKQQRELSHRYMLGLYYILDTLNRKFPKVLFEGCSSGGGRYDAGMLYYMPQTWASDNSDAVCRMKIQYGTSLFFPPVTMGAHVSVSPNLQVGRETPLVTRFAVAMSGNLGYEMDFRILPKEEKETVKEQIAFYKDIRQVLCKGKFYRLLNPQTGNRK